MNRNARQERRLQNLFIGTTVLLFLVAGLLLADHSRAVETRRRQLDRHQATARQAARRLETSLRLLQASLAHLADPSRPLPSTGQLAVDFDLLGHNQPQGTLRALLARDRQGRFPVVQPPGALAPLELDRDLRDFPLHSASSLQLFSDAPAPLLLLSQPLGPTGRQTGELDALLDLQQLVKQVLPDPTVASFCFLLDAHGILLLHRNSRWTGRPYQELSGPAEDPELSRGLRLALQGRSVAFTVDALSPDARRLFAPTLAPHQQLALSPLNPGGAPWTLALAFPAPAESALFGGGLLPGLALLTSLALTLLLGRVTLRLVRRQRELGATQAGLEAEKDAAQTRAELAACRYRHLLDHAGDALFFMDPDDGALLELNPQAEQLLGYTAAEICHLSLQVLFPGPQKHHYLRLVQRVRKKGYAESDALLFRRKDGTLFAGAVHARLGPLGDRQVVHGVLRDVTEHKRVERELRQRNRELTLLNTVSASTAGSIPQADMFQAVLDLVCENFAAAGGGLYLAREAGTALHLEAHRGLRADVLDQVRQIDARQGIVGRVMASGQAKGSADLQRDRRVRFEIVREAGWRGFQATPLTVNDRVVGILFLFHDRKRVYRREEIDLLTAVGRQLGGTVEGASLFEALNWQNRLTQASNRELKRSRLQLHRHLEQMAESNRTLEQLDRMKSNFLALASHELRTPLTYVLSGAELLQNQLGPSLDTDQGRVLEAILQGGRRLDAIVRDLLEVARIESQGLYLAREAIDPGLLLGEASSEFREPCRERQLQLVLGEFPSGCRLLGDPHHLRKTFSRLLENAVKFTPAGGRIEASARLQSGTEILARKEDLQPFSPTFFSTPPAGQLLRVSIRDEGVGIDPEDHLPIFDKFYEVGNISSHFTSTSRFGGKGVGLGLALVKGMIEAHGGMVWVESAGTGAATRGSTFHVLLPTVPAGAGP